MPVINEEFYAEPDSNGVDTVPMEELAPTEQAAPQDFMSADEVLGYQRKKDFSKDTVTSKEVSAAKYYQGAGYDKVNTGLRTGEYTDYRAKDSIPLLDKLIDKAPTLPAPITTYRGVSGSYAATLGQYRPGTIYTDKGFTSTSLSQETAGYFAELRNNQQFLRIEVEVPAGTKGIDMAGFFNRKNPNTGEMVKGEQEWLLARDSKFKVLSNDGKTMRVRIVK
jgi:hypothetical protein